jgi:hypothetical protein
VKTRIASLFLPLALLATSGCVGDAVSDKLETEITLSTSGGPMQPFEINKRFRFSRDPREAQSVSLEESYISILTPGDADLTFMHRVTVYAELGTNRVLIADAQDFEAGQTYADLRIDYSEDIRPLISEDSRLRLVIRVEPNAWYGKAHPELVISTVTQVGFEL